MTRPLRVLAFGTADSASDALRFVAFQEVLAASGVRLGLWPSAASDPGTDSVDALGASLARTDVIVLRRAYVTWDRCLSCGAAGGPGGLADHAPGHDVVPARFGVVRALLDLLAGDRAALGGVGIVYDTDDDLLGADPAPAGATDWLERDLVERMLGLADVVTTTTPTLAARLQPRAGGDVRVIRNAVDPAWYRGGRPAGLPGEPRVVYHGVPSRLGDYELIREPLRTAAARVPGLRTVWLGGDPDGPLAGVVDEVRPWVPGARAFAASLVAAGPDIGLAPLRATAYNAARSELHWLEYALAGAPAVLTRLPGPGPYDVVDDGVDGLLAATPEGWADGLAALASSPALCARIAGAARTRVLRDYTVAARAAEWVRAYRDAARRPSWARR